MTNDKTDAQTDIFGFMPPEIVGLRMGKVEIKNGEIAAFIQGTCNFGTVMQATPECWGIGLAEAIVMLAADADKAHVWVERAISVLSAKATSQPILVDAGTVEDVDAATNVVDLSEELSVRIFSPNKPNSSDDKAA